MAGQKDEAGKPKRVPLVVKLAPEDRDRLDYVCEQTDQTKACLVRRLIREASEGQLKTSNMTINFPPYSEIDRAE